MQYPEGGNKPEYLRNRMERPVTGNNEKGDSGRRLYLKAGTTSGAACRAQELGFCSRPVGSHRKLKVGRCEITVLAGIPHSPHLEIQVSLGWSPRFMHSLLKISPISPFHFIFNALVLSYLNVPSRPPRDPTKSLCLGLPPKTKPSA